MDKTSGTCPVVFPKLTYSHPVSLPLKRFRGMFGTWMLL